MNTNLPARPVLDGEQRRTLRAAAHHLNPVVSVSQKGLAPSVLSEIDRCLRAHELIKVRLYGMERDTRAAAADEICAALACAEVQQIGNLLVLWRKREADNAGGATQRKPGLRRRAMPKTKKQAAAALENRRHRRS